MWLDDVRKFLAEKIAPIEKKADDAIPDRVRGVRIPRVRWILALALLVICVFGYWRGWHNRLWGSALDLLPAATQGNVQGVYEAPPVPKVEQTPATASRIAPRTRKKADLPKKEQDLFPVVPPAPPVAGGDNATILTWAECHDGDGHLFFKAGCEIYRPRDAELAAASTVPPHRADTEVRTYLMPDGSFSTTLLPKPESFVGWPWKNGNWKRLELEGGSGIGGKQFGAQAAWWPLRVGDFRLGVRGEGWMEPAGGTKGAASVRIRWEPFRSQYP